MLYIIPLEEKILRDLDKCDQWNKERLTDLIDGLKKQIRITYMHILIGLVWYVLLTRESAKQYYFSSTAQLFKKRKPIMLQAIRELWKDRASFGF